MHTISFDRLTKSYGPVLAVDGLSFDVGPGRVTGFPGPNGGPAVHRRTAAGAHPHLGATIQHHGPGGVAATSSHTTGSPVSVHLLSQPPRSC